MLHDLLGWYKRNIKRNTDIIELQKELKNINEIKTILEQRIKEIKEVA